VSPWPSIIAVGLAGFGFNTILQASLNYLIDTFTKFAASAVAASTFTRCLFAGCFPLFITPLYHNLGVDWGTTIFACIAAAMVPVPFVFYVWGKRTRAYSKWSKHTV
jgi:MFS transporter, DHA1 family, multidrug resistance protein